MSQKTVPVTEITDDTTLKDCRSLCWNTGHPGSGNYMLHVIRVMKRTVLLCFGCLFSAKCDTIYESWQPTDQWLFS